ncbi:Bifunctional inhibitor/plant lipid transfer protein/seed storage helical domain [Dillenia turbinata]|uniref:Non-specific lipid-transfer protein n=1 Tax=Dillenia turbinata TaxID=194707 RepID=A0AAN8US84_9MAGN
MKIISFSLILILSVLFVLANLSNGAVTCGTVDMKAAPCVTYATGKAPKPSPQCCTGLQQLAGSAKSLDDKKAICRCLKTGVKSFQGVQDKFLSQIPQACNIKSDKGATARKR